MSLDDIWGHAQNVRMWLATAEQSFARAMGKTGGFVTRFLLRGRRHESVAEGADALGKAKVAFMDLEFWLHKNGLPPLRLETMQMQLQLRDALGTADLDRDTVSKLHASLTSDLTQLDALCTDIETKQRAARRT